MAELDIGKTVQRLMRGAWRLDAATVEIDTKELTACQEVLTGAGSGPLAWSRVRRCPAHAGSASGAALRDQYRLSVLMGAMQAETIDRVSSRLGKLDMVPLTFKGWSMASYYPDPHLRPFGDIDLCPPSGRYRDAFLALAAPDAQAVATAPEDEEGGASLFVEGASPSQCRKIDLHRDLAKFRLQPLSAVFARSRAVSVMNSTIRVLAPEDHLRLICLHYLLDGGWRPLSLCDVGAMLDRLDEGFDWNLCFGGDPLARHWITTVLKLAGEMLDARLDLTPRCVQEHELPAWLLRAVLRQWSRPFSHHVAKPRFAPSTARSPSHFAAQIAARWPDPIRATFALEAPFDAKWRWPYQVRHFLRAGTAYLRPS